MVALLIQHRANVNLKSKNGLTPMHLCSQFDRVNVASILAKNNASVSAKTNEGYQPIHVAAHFGQMNMIRFLLQNGSDVNSVNAVSCRVYNAEPAFNLTPFFSVISSTAILHSCKPHNKVTRRL